MFDFPPSHLALNQQGNSFVLYGEGGVFVGNLPTEMELLKVLPSQKLVTAQVELLFGIPETSSVIQAEFCALNTNYLVCLTKDEGAR